MIVFVCWFVRQIYEKNSSKLVYSLFFHTFADILGKFMKHIRKVYEELYANYRKTHLSAVVADDAK